jgi:hypothetical protein
MEPEINAGTVLIKNDVLLPVQLEFASESGIPGWKVVINLDARELEHKIRKTGWTFFSLAGRAKAASFGVDRASMLRRAISGILAKKNSHDFNCLEILDVNFAGSKRFPLVRYLRLSAQWRHIQRDVIAASARKVSNHPLAPRGIRAQVASPAADGVPQRLIA